MRLIAVALDLGEGAPPDNRYFEDLLDLSSGRISQLFAEGSASKLGTKALSRLVAKGFNPDWIQYGKPHAKYLRAGKQDEAIPTTAIPKRQLVRRVCDIVETINDIGLKKLLPIVKDYASMHPVKTTRQKRAKAA